MAEREEYAAGALSWVEHRDLFGWRTEEVPDSGGYHVRRLTRRRRAA